MRQTLTSEDEPFLFIRTLSVNYRAGSREGLHSHKWAQFLFARGGVIHADVDGQRWLIPPSRGLWIPADKSHSIVTTGNLELRTLYLRPDIDVSFDSKTTSSINVTNLLRELILRICAIGYLDQRNASHNQIGTLLMTEIGSQRQRGITLNLPADYRGQKLAEMLLSSENLETRLPELCAQAGVSRRTAERLFLAETGIPLGQWRRLANFSTSVQMLFEGKSIDDVAAQSGYKSRSAFHVAFKRLFGCTPKEFQDSP